MNWWSVVSPPAVGGLIGYITNYIAIKMLFRPLKPVMLGPFRVPFTPGIVPRRKNALAVALGDAIVAKFFNADDLVMVFTSDYFNEAVTDGIMALLRSPEFSLRRLETMQPELIERTTNLMSVKIRDAILESNLPEKMVDEGERALRKRYSRSLVGRAVTRGASYSLDEPITEELRDYLKKHGISLITPFIEKFRSDLLHERIAVISKAAQPNEAAMHKMISEAFSDFMRVNVRHIAESIDVGGMITQKVTEMEAKEIEDLVTSVVNRELKFVIWFGALLGAVIGAVNIFI